MLLCIMLTTLKQCVHYIFFHLQFGILRIRDEETRITHVFHERFMETEK